jgi:hypothetical protein
MASYLMEQSHSLVSKLADQHCFNRGEVTQHGFIRPCGIVSGSVTQSSLKPVEQSPSILL